MKLTHLRYLVQAIETRRIRRSADILHVTQPTITSGIKKLERELGVPLLLRNTRGVIPTEFGQALYLYAHAALRIAEEAKSNIDYLKKGLNGQIVIGTGRGLASAIMPEIIGGMKNAAPNVALRIIEDNCASLLPRMTAGEIDVILSEIPDDIQISPTLETDVVSTTKLVVVAGQGHPLGRKAHVAAEELRNFQWIGIETPGTDSYAALLLGNRPETTENWVSTNSILVLENTLLSASFLAVVPAKMVSNQLKKGKLIRIATCSPNGSIAMGFVRPRSRTANPAIRLFMKIARPYLGKRLM